MKKNIIIFIYVFLNFNLSYAEIDSTEQINIYKNLRCLICQGQSIADSNSEFAQTIKLVVKDQIKEGKTESEIYKFLIEKYGEWIVYKPEFSMNNFFLWFLPYIVLVLGGIIIFNMVKNSRK
jgi:cytochrome c-type biogenesis protein CcmH